MKCTKGVTKPSDAQVDGTGMLVRSLLTSTRPHPGFRKWA